MKKIALLLIFALSFWSIQSFAMVSCDFSVDIKAIKFNNSIDIPKKSKNIVVKVDSSLRNGPDTSAILEVEIDDIKTDSKVSFAGNKLSQLSSNAHDVCGDAHPILDTTIQIYYKGSHARPDVISSRRSVEVSPEIVEYTIKGELFDLIVEAKWYRSYLRL